MSDAVLPSAPDPGADTGTGVGAGRRRLPGAGQVVVYGAILLSLLALPILLVAVVSSGDSVPVSYTIPAGTGARIAAGERVDIMPSTIELKVGQHLVIRNDDSQSYVVGPIAVRPHETVDHRFGTAGTFVGTCALGSTDELTVIVT